MQNNIAIDKSYESYVETLKVKSEDLIKNVLPRKIAELNKLLDSGEFSITHQQKLLDDDLNVPIPDAPAIGPMQSPRTSALNTIDGGESDEDEDEEDEDDEGEKMAKKRKLNNGTAALTATKPQVPSSLYKCNAVISKLIDTLEPFARESLEAGKIFKTWLTILIPKIEDGNNFGVDIQEAILKQVRLGESIADAFYSGVVGYLSDRALYLTKVATNPQIDDYRKLVAQLDKQKLINLRFTMAEIRNQYAQVYDLMIRNWEKIITPRTSNTGNMYK